MGGEFAERKTGGGVHREVAEFLAEGGKAGEPVNVKSRLAVARLREIFVRAFPSDARERPAEDLVGPAEEVAGGGVGGGQVLAHANGLGALAREEKSDTNAHKNLGRLKRQR